MTKFTRRALALSALAAMTVTAACGNGVGNTNPQKIDARVDATLGHLFQPVSYTHLTLPTICSV